jgi:hypothetical protein
MALMFLAMKSITGWILAGSAHPTHVTPVTGKARSWRARTTLEVTDAPSSLSAAEPHGGHARFFLAAPPPKAAPATSALARLSSSSQEPAFSSSSSSSSSYSRTRFFLAARPPAAPLRRPPPPPPPPRSLAVLEAPSRSLRPRISSSSMEMGPNMDSGLFLFLGSRLPRPADAAHTGCCGAAPPAAVVVVVVPATGGRFCASTASPTGSGASESSSSLSAIYPLLISTLTHARTCFMVMLATNGALYLSITGGTSPPSLFDISSRSSWSQ